MPSPHVPQNPEPENRPDVQPPYDHVPSRPGAVMRLRIVTGGFVARHPSLAKLLEGLGWNNPGGSMNP